MLHFFFLMLLIELIPQNCITKKISNYIINYVIRYFLFYLTCKILRSFENNVNCYDSKNLNFNLYNYETLKIMRSFITKF